MITSIPRILAIDDDEKDLNRLMMGLNRLGLACIPVCFQADNATDNISTHPHIRVVFTDLHLIAGGSSTEHRSHFSLIGSILEETVKPLGPYILILWTKFSDQASDLQGFLEERLQNTPKPISVVAIDKMEFLGQDDDPETIERLVSKINGLFEEQPQICALLNWEERVLAAAAETTASVFNLAQGPNRGAEVGRLLARLAVEAAGKERILQIPEENVIEGRFRAVSEALLPILADHISVVSSVYERNDAWMTAFTRSDVNEEFTIEEAAKLNSRAHFASADGVSGSDRGSVISLPTQYSCNFEQTFGLSQECAADKQFRCNEFVVNDDRFRWVLVQSQAACDFAQQQPGPLPYYLGLELPVTNRRSGTPPAALWRSPTFKLNGIVQALHVNVRFPVSLSDMEGSCQTPLYRLREQLISNLVFQIHSYGSRPGLISYHET